MSLKTKAIKLMFEWHGAVFWITEENLCDLLGKVTVDALAKVASFPENIGHPTTIAVDVILPEDAQKVEVLKDSLLESTRKIDEQNRELLIRIEDLGFLNKSNEQIALTALAKIDEAQKSLNEIVEKRTKEMQESFKLAHWKKSIANVTEDDKFARLNFHRLRDEVNDLKHLRVALKIDKVKDAKQVKE